MIQTVREQFQGTIEEKNLPPDYEEVIPGVRSGLSHALFTPAYWAAEWWYARRTCDYADYRRGTSLREEVAACLLGGHGITAEMNSAAFMRLRERGLLAVSRPPTWLLAETLSEPLLVRSRPVRLCEA